MRDLITRRNLLKRSLLTAATTSIPAILGCFSSPTLGNSALAKSNDASRKKIIIIGAGLAGLASAYLLNERTKGSFDIVMLEARDRVGGRVETLREPFSDKLFAETGAFWISDSHFLALSYIRDFGLKTVELMQKGKRLQYYLQSIGTPVAIDDDGMGVSVASELKERSLRDWEQLGGDERSLGLYGILGKYFCSRPEIVDAAAPGWPSTMLSAELHQYDHMSFLELLQELDISSGAIALIRPWFAWWDDLDKVSALSLLRDGAVTRQMCSDAHPKWFTLENGMDSLPKAFSQNLSGKIKLHLDAAAVAIRQDDRSVTVTYQQHGKSNTELGDYLICAIPFSTLRGIETTPSFSRQKRDAVSELNYASVARVYLQCSKKVWDLNGHSNGVVFTDITNDAKEKLGNCGMNLLDMTAVQGGNRGILQGYMVGSLGKFVTSLGESQRIDFFLQQMRNIWPEITRYIEPQHCTTRCWDDEKWSLGAYPVFRPGQMMKIMPNIAKPEGRVFFAGDHTSGRPGWMEGALQSGHRAAKEVLRQAAKDARQV